MNMDFGLCVERDEGDGSVEEDDGTGNRLSARQGSVFFLPQRTRSESVLIMMSRRRFYYFLGQIGVIPVRLPAYTYLPSFFCVIGWDRKWHGSDPTLENNNDDEAIWEHLRGVKVDIKSFIKFLFYPNSKPSRAEKEV